MANSFNISKHTLTSDCRYRRLGDLCPCANGKQHTILLTEIHFLKKKNHLNLISVKNCGKILRFFFQLNMHMIRFSVFTFQNYLIEEESKTVPDVGLITNQKCESPIAYIFWTFWLLRQLSSILSHLSPRIFKFMIVVYYKVN